MTDATWRTARNWGARLRETAFFGIPALTLENEVVRVTVLTGKGGDLVEFLHKPSDVDYAWLSSDAALAAGRVAREGPRVPFLDSYLGGWQEVLPNGGAPSSHRGAVFDQHGDVATEAWDWSVVTDTAAEVAVRLSVRSRRTPLRVTKIVRLRSGEPALQVESVLSNESAVPVDFMWGQHITFGPPFLRPGCRIRLPEGCDVIPHPVPVAPPGRRVAADRPGPAWPRAYGPDGALVRLDLLPEPNTPSELVYLTGFAAGWYEVVDERAGRGFRVEWDASVMPYLWYWQEFGGTTGYPWYGRHYNIGLEPFSSYPTDGLASAVENGSALRLDAHQERALTLTAQVLNVTASAEGRT